MPTFQIGLDDGRTLRIDADSHEAALAGAQHFMETSGPRTNAAGAATEGFLDTAGLGLRDEIRGLSAATGLPEWLGGLRAPVGLAELGYEKLRGQKDLTSLVTGDQMGPVERAYTKERDFTRQAQKQSQEEHPTAYLGGQVGGAVTGALTLPGFQAARGAGMGARVAAGVKTGAIQGAAYGFGSGEGLADSLGQGAIGGATGAVLGGAGVPVADAIGFGANAAVKAGSGLYQAVRAEMNPEFTTREATRRILQARADDLASRSIPMLTEADRAMAQRTGIDLSAADVSGMRTLKLARSAADQSPEARGSLAGVAQDRFTGQQQRAGRFIKDLTGGADAAGDIEAIRAEARRVNAPAYARAYEAGDRPVWSPEMERLTAAPAIQDAMKSAVKSGQNRAVEEGFGGFNPPVTVTPDGRLQFNRTPSGGNTYPNLQFWDYVQRDLKDMAEKVAGREPDKFRYLNSLHQQLNTELDQLVPQFQNARLGAWRAFQAEDAVEAGKNFATSRAENSEFGRAIAKMSAPDRELFARGYASELAGRILETRDNQNILNQAFLTSQAAKQRHAMALGPQRAKQLEAYLRVESLADRLRNEMGNSRTAEYLHQAGLAAGGGLGLLAGEHFGGENGGAWGSIMALGGAFLAHKAVATQGSVATEVGRLLASQDPRVFRRGVDVVARTPWLMDTVRRAGDRLDRILARTAQPQIQQPLAGAISQATQ